MALSIIQISDATRNRSGVVITAGSKPMPRRRRPVRMPASRISTRTFSLAHPSPSPAASASAAIAAARRSCRS
eukprot:9239282-Pyramimonas_sp.AAC.1